MGSVGSDLVIFFHSRGLAAYSLILFVPKINIRNKGSATVIISLQPDTERLTTILYFFLYSTVAEDVNNLDDVVHRVGHGSLFYSAPQCSHCKRYTSYGNSVRPSVCLSVRPSHAGIVSKQRHVGQCSLHCQIAKCV